jgi:predicted metal-dependent phosphoesterase TrpH
MLKKIILPVIAIIILYFLPVKPSILTDIVHRLPAEGFSISWPLLRYIIEPFAGITEYILSFSRYMVQLFSWICWLGIFWIVAGIARKKSITAILRNAAFSWLIILSLLFMAILLPFPAPHLNAPANTAVIDLHSHSFYSHDGVVSPLQSIAYHNGLGFSSFFITEHGHTDSFTHFPKERQLHSVYPGMQVSTKERVSLLVLADRPYNGAEFRDKTVKEVIDLAHQKGFVVLCPHWWKWRYFTWQQLVDFGIDGFEVYNAGYRKFSEEERNRLIDFCKEKHVLAVGTTDWHGWGYMSNVWTVIGQPQQDAAAVVVRLRSHQPVRVLVTFSLLI